MCAKYGSECGPHDRKVRIDDAQEGNYRRENGHLSVAIRGVVVVELVHEFKADGGNENDAGFRRSATLHIALISRTMFTYRRPRAKIAIRAIFLARRIWSFQSTGIGKKITIMSITRSVEAQPV